MPVQAEVKFLSSIIKFRKSPKRAHVAIRAEEKVAKSAVAGTSAAAERGGYGEENVIVQESSSEQIFQQGFREGQQEAETRMCAEYEEALANERQKVRALLSSFEAQQKAYHQSLEQSTMKFGLAVAEIIIKREVSLDKELVLQQVREALKRIVGVERIKLRVNPQDESIVKESRTAVTEDFDSVREIVIEIDETIEPGGCILESDSGNVDARLSTQLKKIEESLFETPSR